MEILQISKENAIRAFKEANDKGKALLTNLFGEKVFSQKITDRLKTFEDCCEELEVDPKKVLPYLNPSNKDEISINAYAKLIIILRAFNEGWVPDWSNSNQYKYFPWLQYKSGFGFSITTYDGWHTGAGVGSRLCLKSSDLAIHVGKQFEKEYNEYFNL